MAGLLPLIATAHYSLFTLMFKRPINMLMENGAHEGRLRVIEQGGGEEGERPWALAL